VPGHEASSRRTRRTGHHREEVRRHTGGSPLESGVPCGEGFGHGLPGLMQTRQVIIHLLQETLAGSADRMTGWTPAVTRFQKTRQLLRREPEADGVPDKQEARDGLVGVVAKAAFGPRCPRQHANALAVADEIRADASTACRLTDSERPSCHTPSYNLESFQILDPVLT
jgi:hypothetical protein